MKRILWFVALLTLAINTAQAETEALKQWNMTFDFPFMKMDGQVDVLTSAIALWLPAVWMLVVSIHAMWTQEMLAGTRLGFTYLIVLVLTCALAGHPAFVNSAAYVLFMTVAGAVSLIIALLIAHIGGRVQIRNENGS